jgi:hypothetical protein
MKSRFGNISVLFSSIVLSGSLMVTKGVHVQSAPVIYQAEDGNHYFCHVRAKHAGYEGAGYLDFRGQGAWVEWDINVPSAGDYEVSVRYASPNTRPADLELDDGPVVATFELTGTSLWTEWSTETHVLSLSQGVHKFHVVASNSTGANIDWISIQEHIDAEEEIGEASEEQVLEEVLALTPTGSPEEVLSLPPTGSPNALNIFQEFQQSVVIDSNNFLVTGDTVSSPSGEFNVRFNGAGNLVLDDQNGNVLWSTDVSGGFKCFMQQDGNLIIRNSAMNALWTSDSSTNEGARLILDDGGRLSVMLGNSPVWMAGLPRGEYTGPSSPDLQFPIRGIFYYPWYPETWFVNGAISRFQPDLEWYSSSDPAVIEDHIDQLEYAHVDLSIASWWGQGSMLDRSRISLLMDATTSLQSNIKWSIYYEDERMFDPSLVELKADLDYLKKWFAWHPAWAHVDGRPLIFVYNENGCEIAERWTTASAGEWYVVLKVFKGFRECSFQPDSWHQYGPADAVNHVSPTFAISPGFWKADIAEPLLPRVSASEWHANVLAMVASGEPWQLITTFNEAGEGTLVEASSDWQSDSGYGYYLDSLNEIH